MVVEIKYFKKVIHVTCGWVFHFLTKAYNFTILIFLFLSLTNLDKQSFEYTELACLQSCCIR